MISLLVVLLITTAVWKLSSHFQTVTQTAMEESAAEVHATLAYDFEKKVSMLARSTAHAVAPHIANRNISPMQDVMEQLTTLYPVEAAYFFDASGVIVYSSTSELHTLERTLNEVTNITRPLSNITIQDDATHTLTAVSLIEANDRVLGGVLLRFSTAQLEHTSAALQNSLTDSLQNHREEMLQQLGGAMLLLLLTAAAIAYIVARHLTMPISMLTSTVQTMGHNEAAFVPLTQREDEVGDLSRTMHTMAETLKETTLSRDYLNNILHTMYDAVLVTNSEERITFVNNAACMLLHTSRDQLMGRWIGILSAATDNAALLHSIQQLREDGSLSGQEVALTLHEDRKVCVVLSASKMHPASHDSSDTIWMLHDVTQRKKLEEQLRHSAMHDALTGLPNRSALLEKLTLAYSRASRDASFCFGLIFMDLDHFKHVNDTLGHAAGDALLMEVAHRLTREVRALDTVARLGGDEFVLLLEGLTSNEELKEAANRIIATIEQPFVIQSEQAHISASLGLVAGSGQYNTSIDDLMLLADTAMYRVKTQGRGRYLFYTPEEYAVILEQIHLERELKAALSSSQLDVFFQPVLSVADNSIIGLEALLHWNHPQQGVVSPATFIPVAEDSSLIYRLDFIALEKTLALLFSLSRQFGKLHISINISAKQLTDTEQFQALYEKLQSSALCKKLILEIPESALLDGSEITAPLVQLKELGVSLILDDYSGQQTPFHDLIRFPFDSIKIDRSFMVDVLTNPRKQTAIRHMAKTGRMLKKQIIAKGVESEELLSFIHQAGCTAYQGYLCSGPIPLTELHSFLTRWHTDNSEHIILQPRKAIS